MSGDNYLDKKLGTIYAEMKILDDNWQLFNKGQFYKLLRLQQQLTALTSLVQTEVIGVEEEDK